MMKTLLYFFQVLSEDLESQKRGIVIVSFPSINFDPTTICDPKSKRLISDCLDSIAIRISASHLCFPDEPWFHALGSLFLLASTPSIRVRTRLHFGKYYVFFLFHDFTFINGNIFLASRSKIRCTMC